MVESHRDTWSRDWDRERDWALFNFFLLLLTAQIKTLKSVLQLWRVSEEWTEVLWQRAGQHMAQNIKKERDVSP